MVETAAEPCPNCGELTEFGIPEDYSAVKKVKSSGTYNKRIECHECGKNIKIQFR
jgi:rRNA maturation protein Nop10